MNQITPPPKIEIIPSSAPFSEAQRSWQGTFHVEQSATDAESYIVARKP